MVTFDPACIESQKGFRLLAVRILPECAPYIRKCLAENEFYYLNNDYKISEDGNLIERRSEFVPPIRDDFFQTGEENTPRINISAIVGKNGDGKSTIVEVIIRLLNNFAFDYGIGEKNSLKKAEGLCAELYYQLDGTFYRLEEKKEDENRTVNLNRYNNDKTDGRLRLSSTLLSRKEIWESFFYTLVTNYSHYAYNTLEVDREVEHGNDKEHWLHRVFHKNDGYQVPLSLHPYREEGIIDLNNETWLSKQRVLMTFVQSYLKNEEGQKMQFNGKNAVELVLSDVGTSQLQQITLRHYLQAKAGVRLLDEVSFDSMDPNNEYDSAKLVGVGTTIYSIFDSYISPNLQFFKNAYDWFDKEKLLDKRSDLFGLMMFIQGKNQDPSFFKVIGDFKKINRQWKNFKRLSWIQIQRLLLIVEICNLWRTEGLNIGDKKDHITFDLSLDSIFKDYADLNNDEKCLHYLVYKTISIFETYNAYGLPCAQYENQVLFIDGRVPRWSRINSVNAEAATVSFHRLALDWVNQSHITLKLRQAYNYYIDKDKRTKNTYETTKGGEVPSDRKIHIKLNHLTESQKITLSCLETLPPAIYHWDIIFSSDDKDNLRYGNERIAMESFSSGEKQKLYSQSAVVYHLQNISSISNVFAFHYHAVNIILEEIELYFHPDWQRTFCNDLMEMIRSANVKNIDSVNITFVTHSPYILSDIPKTNVLFLKDGRPDYSMQENTFGANINTLLKNGFFLPSLPIGEFAHQKINSMFAKLQSGEFDKTMIDELQSEVMMVGEPYIRQQLMTLLKMYMGIDKNLVMECIRELYLEQRKHD